MAILLFVTGLGATHIDVDVNNVVLNSQGNTPNSSDNLGAGVSRADGVLYLPDGFLSGYTSLGLWDYADNGLGTIDTIATGGTPFPQGGQIMGTGLPARPGDANGVYLGIGGTPGAGEYAVFETALVVTTLTTLSFTYQWAAAGGTLTDGTELLIGDMMGVEFFFDTDLNYANGGRVFTAESGLQSYTGAGTQAWHTATGEVTLAPGTYYWGFTVYGNSDVANYIVLDGISIQSIPEPSSAILTGVGGLLLLLFHRRRRNRS